MFIIALVIVVVFFLGDWPSLSRFELAWIGGSIFIFYALHRMDKTDNAVAELREALESMKAAAEEEKEQLDELLDDDDDFPHFVATVICAECFTNRYFAQVFATEYMGPDNEHMITCEYHGEIPAVVLTVTPLPDAL